MAGEGMVLRANFLFIVVQIFFSYQAWACKCPTTSYSEEGSRRNIERADMVIWGKFQKVFPGAQDSRSRQKVSLEVLKLYKGEKLAKLEALFDLRTSCRTQVKMGGEKLILLYKKKGQWIHAGPCSGFVSPKDLNRLKNGTFFTKASAHSTRGKRTSLIVKKIPTPPFPKKFQSKQALEKWAQGPAMGGKVESVYHSPLHTTLLIVNRSYTSGVPSSDVSVYAPIMPKGYNLVYSHPGVYGLISYRKVKKGLQLIHRDLAGKAKIIKEIRIEDLTQ